LRVRNRLTAKTIAPPDITDDATDWRHIAAKLLVVNRFVHPYYYLGPNDLDHRLTLFDQSK